MGIYRPRGPEALIIPGWRLGNADDVGMERRVALARGQRHALAYAESHLAVGETARVEKVVSSCGHSSPLGTGWTATCAEGVPIEWVPFRMMP